MTKLSACKNAIILSVSLTLTAIFSAAHAAPPGTPSYITRLSDSLIGRAYFTHWEEALARQARYFAMEHRKKEFAAYVLPLRRFEGAELIDIAQAVNKYTNQRLVYASDLTAHDEKEYWASASETLTAGKGDCDDYAVLNYCVLRALGVSADRVALAVVASKNAENDDHAIIVLDTRKDISEKTAFTSDHQNLLVLENSNKKTPRLRKLSDTGYTLKFLMNEKMSWNVATQKGVVSVSPAARFKTVSLQP